MSAPLRVLINGIHAKSGGGVTYLRNILPELAKIPGLELHLLLHPDQKALFSAATGGIQVHFRDFPAGMVPSLVWEQIVLPFLARRLEAELVFSPANYGPLLAPRPVIMLRNSLAVLGEAKSLYQRVYWIVLTAMTAASLLTARRAIAVSSYSADLLSFRCARLRRKVRIVHHGVAESFRAPAEAGAKEDFLLAVSDLYIQKNLHSLIEAMALLAADFPDLRLKIAGRPVDASYAARIEALIRERGLDGRVELLGGVEPERLRALYRACRIFVFPSTVETFGNPLVEAMVSGAVIACSDSAAMPEILGDAGTYFAPSDVPGMAAVLRRLLADPAEAAALSRRAAARAANFSWRRTAEATATILFEAAGRR